MEQKGKNGVKCDETKEATGKQLNERKEPPEDKIAQ